jgi:hypothetical protein
VVTSSFSPTGQEIRHEPTNLYVHTWIVVGSTPIFKLPRSRINKTHIVLPTTDDWCSCHSYTSTTAQQLIHVVWSIRSPLAAAALMTVVLVFCRTTRITGILESCIAVTRISCTPISAKRQVFRAVRKGCNYDIHAILSISHLTKFLVNSIHIVCSKLI